MLTLARGTIGSSFSLKAEGRRFGLAPHHQTCSGLTRANAARCPSVSLLASDPHDPFATITRRVMSHADRTLLVLKGARFLGELGTVWRYSYWSDRRVRDIAADNAIDLDRRWRTAFRTPLLGFAPQAELAEERGAVQRHEIAVRVERAIGQLAVEDFVTPPPAAFAKGCGEVTFAVYTRWSAPKKNKRKAVIVHTRTKSSDGSRIEVCLFGSIENCAGYLSGRGTEAPMWSASSTWAIEEFIDNLGRKPAPMYDDDEAIAVEILRTINNEGMIGSRVRRRIASAEWFAEVYKDVELDKDRWTLKPESDIPEPVDRIVIGAPLWVRSSGR
jgi:hypothetical protein